MTKLSPQTRACGRTAAHQYAHNGLRNQTRPSSFSAFRKLVRVGLIVGRAGKRDTMPVSSETGRDFWAHRYAGSEAEVDVSALRADEFVQNIVQAAGCRVHWIFVLSTWQHCARLHWQRGIVHTAAGTFSPSVNICYLENSSGFSLPDVCKHMVSSS